MLALSVSLSRHCLFYCLFLFLKVIMGASFSLFLFLSIVNMIGSW